MNARKKDPFVKIHALLREKQYAVVLGMLVKKNHKGIKKLYASYDQNHSWYIVGDVFFKLGKYDQAISAFKKALEIWPEDKDAILALSNSYSESSLPKKAENILKRGLKIYPNDEAFIYNLACALFDQGKYKKAIDFYKVIKDDSELRGLSKKNIKASNRNLKKSAKKRSGSE